MFTAKRGFQSPLSEKRFQPSKISEPRIFFHTIRSCIAKLSQGPIVCTGLLVTKEDCVEIEVSVYLCFSQSWHCSCEIQRAFDSCPL